MAGVVSLLASWFPRSAWERLSGRSASRRAGRPRRRASRRPFPRGAWERDGRPPPPARY